MAIVILQTLPNVGREGFDQPIEELQKQGPLPADGSLFHASGPRGQIGEWSTSGHPASTSTTSRRHVSVLPCKPPET